MSMKHAIENSELAQNIFDRWEELQQVREAHSDINRELQATETQIFRNIADRIEPAELAFDLISSSSNYYFLSPGDLFDQGSYFTDLPTAQSLLHLPIHKGDYKGLPFSVSITSDLASCIWSFTLSKRYLRRAVDEQVQALTDAELAAEQKYATPFSRLIVGLPQNVSLQHVPLDQPLPVHLVTVGLEGMFSPVLFDDLFLPRVKLRQALEGLRDLIKDQVMGRNKAHARLTRRLVKLNGILSLLQ